VKTKEIHDHNQERLLTTTNFLKWYRINLGLSQQELSESAKISRNTVVRYESNSPKNLTLLTVFEIADAMELDVNQIFLEVE